jgi:hypothetical protein
MCGKFFLFILNILSYTANVPVEFGNVSVRAAISVGLVGKNGIVKS